MADIDGPVTFCLNDGTPNRGRAVCAHCGGTHFLPVDEFVAYMFARLRALETAKRIPPAPPVICGESGREPTDDFNELAGAINRGNLRARLKR
jgi:hypothetical protein